ncbi:MAG: hypothetical protein KC619_02350 [Myxococcales bacterium]|nr:hypothetical protein [Myxococcales bacterium]
MAPPHRVALFTYEGADVVTVPVDVESVSDEPVEGDVIPELITTEGAVKATVVLRDANLKCIVQLLGWHRADGDSSPTEGGWQVLETIDDKKNTITIEAKFPPASLGGGA